MKNIPLYIRLLFLVSPIFIAGGCGTSGASSRQAAAEVTSQDTEDELRFCGDSARLFVHRQVEAGPRVPGSDPHRHTAAWIESKLKAYGLATTVQNATLKAFDGTSLPIYNILGSVNPDSEQRLLFVAHWDTRPWADQDADETKRRTPVDGANDGASGVGVLLELGRVLAGTLPPDNGVDLLFVDAEDWGEENNDESWAMGTRYFVQNPPVQWKRPQAAVVVDMVGDREAIFPREYFSEQAAPDLNDRVWALASSLGYGELFPNRLGGVITDDHVELIKAGIPAIDIIDYRLDPPGGFCPQWHTTDDSMTHISAQTLEAVGRTLEKLIRTN